MNRRTAIPLLCVVLAIGAFCSSMGATHPARSLDNGQMLEIFGGQHQNYCCKVVETCGGTEFECSDPAPGENPSMPIESRCAARTKVDVIDDTRKDCLQPKSGASCTSSNVSECKRTYGCQFNYTSLACEPTASYNSVNAPETCTDQGCT